MFKPPTRDDNFEKVYRKIFAVYNVPGNNDEKEQRIMSSGSYVPDIVRDHLRTASLKTPLEIYNYNNYGYFAKKPIRSPIKLPREEKQ